MTYYGPQQQAPKAPKWKRWQKVVVGISFLLIGLICCGAGLSGALSDNHKSSPVVNVKTVNPPVTGTKPAAAAAAAKAHTLTASDFKLTVKTTDKDCFGSAGCNVQYQIKAAIGAPAQDCDVTYDVHGLQDQQTGTLTVHEDGTYDQESYQAGQTTSSSKKLTAVVTDVDCL